MSKMPKRGVPKGNQNARKHGLYAKALTEAERLELEEASQIEGLDEEIAILRVKLKELLKNEPERIDLHLEAANTMARLVRIRCNISKEQKNSLKEAIAKVLAEIALPLGIGVAIKKMPQNKPALNSFTNPNCFPKKSIDNTRSRLWNHDKSYKS